MADCIPGILYFWLWSLYWSLHDISRLDLYISPSFSHTPTLSVWWASVVLEGALPFPHNHAIYSPRKRGDEWGKDGWRRGKGRAGVERKGEGRNREGDDSSSVRREVHQCLNPQTCIYSHPTILTNEPWDEEKKEKMKDGRDQGKYAPDIQILRANNEFHSI